MTMQLVSDNFTNYFDFIFSDKIAWSDFGKKIVILRCNFKFHKKNRPQISFLIYKRKSILSVVNGINLLKMHGLIRERFTSKLIFFNRSTSEMKFNLIH